MRALLLACLVGCGTEPPADSAAPSTTAPCTPVAWFADLDGDLWGDVNAVTVSCEPVLHAVTTPGDCDDADPLVHPDAPDRCDGFDADCDGVIDEDDAPTTWYVDADGDGVGGVVWVESCAQPAGFTEWPGDCDDGDPDVFPGAPERCNGRDDDCDGAVPPDEADADGDGHAPCAGDCDDGDPARHPGAVEVCGGVDDDCDGVLLYDEFDQDNDGQTPCDGDCDDADPLVLSGGFESAGDGVDSDCDGVEWCFLDADGDGVGSSAVVISTDLQCDGPNEAPTSGDCDDLDPLRSGGQAEIPWDGVDNDCDPATPDDDLDGDGFPLAEDCDDLDAAVNPANPPAVWFEDVTVQAGLWVTAWDPVLHPPVCGELMSGGATAADYDGDGWIDLFIPRQHERDQLFRNQGDGTFVDVAVASGIDHAGTTAMGLFFDMDGDGDLDLFAVSHGDEGHRLYENLGGGSFGEVPGAGGMDLALPAGQCSLVYGVAAADVDGDGDLDVHTQQWHAFPGWTGDGSRLFLNDGTGSFTDATQASGLDLTARAAFATGFGDVDGDGDLDLALAADWGESGLWANDGTGVFTEVTTSAGVGLDRNGMGSTLADFDRDGDLDWFVTAIYDPDPLCVGNWDCDGNFLYVNDGTGSFTDGTDAAGVRDGRWGWGAAFFDYDNDGDLDLGMTNGFHLDPMWQLDPLRLWENDGTGAFDDVACETGVQLRGQGTAFLPFDYDNDGDLDLLTTLTDGPPRLYENRNGDQRSWLVVEASEPGNPFGIGAVVEVEPVQGGEVQRWDVTLNNTYASVRPPRAHFGLGAHEGSVYEVRVRWPDGAVTAVGGVAPRQVLAVAR